MTGNGGNLSGFLPGIEQELRRRSYNAHEINKIVILNMSDDPNVRLREFYDQIVKIYGSEKKIKRRLYLWAYRLGVRGAILEENKSDPMWEVPGRPLNLLRQKM